MSKHLFEADETFENTAPMCHSTPVAFNIRLMDQDAMGNPTSADDIRYIRISDSSGSDEIHPMRLVNGEAYIRLEDMNAAQFTLVQVDENGNQMINGDDYAISYMVDGRTQDEDYARVYDSINDEIAITIINMPIVPVTLHVVKVLYDEFGEPLTPNPNMNFTVTITGMGCSEVIDLNCDNDFHVVLDTLRAGIYDVYEVENDCFDTTYALDGEAPSTCEQFSLYSGCHTLEIVNRRRPATVLTLDKYIRDANGELIKPRKTDCFNIRVLGDYYDQVFELNESNDFAIDVCELPPGLYDVMEVDQSCYEVSYLVNSAPESPYAHVELKNGCAASVLIINSVQCCTQESPLRICKYIRRSDNCLVKPDPCDSFKVMLSGCGTCEIFNLNAGNNFCVDIEHICCGEYEVKELDHDDYQTSYIVNDGCETTSACLYVHEGSFHNVTIINEERNKGEVTISKVIRGKDGTINKPDKSKRFLVTLRSFFCRETFVLDASNDFCVHVYHLREGSYEVKERSLDDYDTTYIIDNGKEMRKARFLVTNEACSDVKIINSVKKEQSGDLRICKYIANAYGDYVKPSVDEEFEIQVQGPCVDNCYTLRASNNWCVILEGLKKGVYRVTECPNHHFDAQYFVNGCEMDEAALVCMEKDNQEVNIINTRRSYGNLKLSVVVEDCDDYRHKPNQSEYFDIIVETASGSKVVRLDERNNFGVLLEDMEQGRIRITQKDSYGYRVSYEVDGVQTNKAVAEMCGQNVSVTMINRTMDCAGMVRVRKFVETLSGRIIKPCEDDCYTFTLNSRCMNNEYHLNAQNDFCVIFDDLEEDCYEIKEACVEGMKTRYRINGKDSESGKFTLELEDMDIEIINTVLPLPQLHVTKRIRECKELIKPQSWESFHFQLIGRGVHETYCLNADNDWCVAIEGLQNQHYEIRELDVNCPVSYQINRKVYEKGTFLFKNEDMNVMIINEAPSDAIVNICQWVRDENQEVVKPCRDDRFDLILESDCFKQCLTLDCSNDWCVAVEGLANGTYQIKDATKAKNEVWIDGQPTEEACFTLDQCDVEVALIRPFGCENALVIQAETCQCDRRATPGKDKCYHVHVEHEGICDDFVLDRNNDWCIELANICLGEYRIYADEDVLYESDGTCFEQCIDIQMNCDTCTVTLVEELPAVGEMLITKRIQSKDGTFHKPPCGSRFNIMLIGNEEECFELCEQNDWTMRLCNYPFGAYEVIEQASSNARYQINQGAIKSHGRFRLETEKTMITVINPMHEEECPTNAGSLTVHAMVKNCDGDFMSAPMDARFEVMVDGSDVREDVILTERNGFARTFHHLPQGKILITQKPNPAFTRVTYRIHGLEQPVGEIDLSTADVHVDLINYSNCKQGSIRVSKYIKDASCGCLKRPCMEEEYTIALIKEDWSQRVILNASNQWSYVFAQLTDGTYQIKEETNGNVSYMINGDKEQGEAIIEVAGNETNVKVINPSAASVNGSIELCKYVKNAQGEEVAPKDQSFWISVIGEDSTQRILLHEANHYYAEVRNLASGMYEVKEEEQTGATYRVNNALESDRALVGVNGNKNSVDIINPNRQQGTSLLLEKWIMDEQGAMSKPKDGVYRIHVSAPGYNEIFSLDSNNGFSYRIEGLKAGLYVVDELDHEQVTYMIDGSTPVDRAIVNVTSHHEVMIVNPAATTNAGSIRLTKYIRTASGQLQRPQGNATYQFHVSKPGFNEIYTLDVENNWSVTLTGLENGNYVISEMDQDGKVSYIINEGSESDFGIVAVNQNQNIVSIINSESSINGSITITKYIRDEEGGLRRPFGDYATSVHVSRPGYNEVFPLNRSNHWQIRILDLMDGQYILDEMDSEDEVTWRINGGSEVRYAVVHVSHNENQVDMINTRLNNGNSLKLKKFIRNTANQLVKPERDESFTVLISGAKTMRVVLNQENDWQSTISELPNGTYHIKESSSDYEVTYVINHGEEKDIASVSLDNQDAEITLINTMRGSRNVLELSKYIKTSQGALITPVEGDVYQVQVSGPNFQETYPLTHDNAFSVRLNNLANGNYTVEEVGDGEYVTTYRVNGGQETNSAMVSVNEGKTNIVEIINERTSDHNTLEVFKYLMDRQGNFNQPSGSQVFRFLLTGSNLHQFYTLNEANKWHVRVEGLADGEYEVIEQGGGTNVQYLVDGADFSSTGEFVAKGGSENIVEIVNVEQNNANGSIQLEKKIRNSDGDLIIPGNGESFSIRIFTNDQSYDEIFTLDELNGYILQVNDLAFGEYHVEEIENSGFATTYIVNDGMENTSAIVTLKDETTQNVMVINTQTSLYLQVKDNDDIRIVIE